jgi:hypothetical protein
MGVNLRSGRLTPAGSAWSEPSTSGTDAAIRWSGTNPGCGSCLSPASAGRTVQIRNPQRRRRGLSQDRPAGVPDRGVSQDRRAGPRPPAPPRLGRWPLDGAEHGNARLGTAGGHSPGHVRRNRQRGTGASRQLCAVAGHRAAAPAGEKFNSVELSFWAPGETVASYYAPNPRYGQPEALMAFIDACHQRDIGVILDWIPPLLPREGQELTWFDGTRIYDRDVPGQPDVGVRSGTARSAQFLAANALFWRQVYHVDALRTDARTFAARLQGQGCGQICASCCGKPPPPDAGRQRRARR